MIWTSLWMFLALFAISVAWWILWFEFSERVIGPWVQRKIARWRENQRQELDEETQANLLKGQTEQ